MINTNEVASNKRYTIAVRAVGKESLIVAGALIVSMTVWACFISDKRFLFVPLIFLAVSFAAFISLLFRYIAEPKTAIQADSNGIYFYYRNKKEVYIAYEDIVEVVPMGATDVYGRILIKTESNEYQSIRTNELTDKLLRLVKNLLNAENKEEYLIKNEIKKRSKKDNSF